MKIRYGFVSNSSSSSFTCDVCGETQSGMDMGRSEAGMVECREGHTFCDSHQIGPDVTPSIEKKKQDLKDIILDRKYSTPEKKQLDIDKISAMTDDEVVEEWSDYNGDDLFPEYCPLCQLLDVTDGDIARYFMVNSGFKTHKETASHLKDKFKTYKAFKAYINPPKIV